MYYVFGSPKEHEFLKLEALIIQQDFMRSDGKAFIINAINNLLGAYLETHCDFSDQLMILFSKSLVQQELAKVGRFSRFGTVL